jgi:hypothetical protein
VLSLSFPFASTFSVQGRKRVAGWLTKVLMDTVNVRASNHVHFIDDGWNKVRMESKI